MTIKRIQVTNTEIRNGYRGDSGECPVALSVGKVLKKGYHPRVTRYSIDIFREDRESYDDTIFSTSAPEEVREFVFAFDDDCDVDPFEFSIELPDEVVENV